MDISRLVNPAGSGPAVALCWEARTEIMRLRIVIFTILQTACDADTVDAHVLLKQIAEIANNELPPVSLSQ